MDHLPAPPKPIQGTLFPVEKHQICNGVEMGVLKNGTPYLTESGLARMCDIDRKVLYEMASEWESGASKPRIEKIRAILAKAGYFENSLFINSDYNGAIIHAYVEPVCMAILEYYAFDAKPVKEHAQQAFRSLARGAFTEFVYQALGYTPKLTEAWDNFHHRIDLTWGNVPLGYFSIFKESAGLVVPMIQGGVYYNDTLIPDLSIGQMWSKHWNNNTMSGQYGERIKYDHFYPDNYRQAKSNPQEAWAYPNMALGAFRDWIYQDYLVRSFPNYVMNKKHEIGEHEAKRLIESVTRLSLPG